MTLRNNLRTKEARAPIQLHHRVAPCLKILHPNGVTACVYPKGKAPIKACSMQGKVIDQSFVSIVKVAITIKVHKHPYPIITTRAQAITRSTGKLQLTGPYH